MPLGQAFLVTPSAYRIWPFHLASVPKVKCFIWDCRDRPTRGSPCAAECQGHRQGPFLTLHVSQKNWGRREKEPGLLTSCWASAIHPDALSVCKLWAICQVTMALPRPQTLHLLGICTSKPKTQIYTGTGPSIRAWVTHSACFLCPKRDTHLLSAFFLQVPTVCYSHEEIFILSPNKTPQGKGEHVRQLSGWWSMLSSLTGLATGTRMSGGFLLLHWTHADTVALGDRVINISAHLTHQTYLFGKK